MSSLFWILGRVDDALYHAKLATDIARKEDCSIVLVMALASEAGTNQALGRSRLDDEEGATSAWEAAVRNVDMFPCCLIVQEFTHIEALL